MSLSNEDSLRLNVLLVNAVAIKMNEGTMCIQGLLKQGGETTFKLCPNCNHEQYTKQVKELLSSNALGSPGGYPVFLKRWARMGQTSDDARLADLLLLAEPEACIAVTSSNRLTDVLAARVWWAMPDAKNARRMLRNPAVAQGRMGKILAEFLLEFLPFEQEANAIIDSVALILQPGLIAAKAVMDIWERGRKKGVFRLGFLKTIPDDLPEKKQQRDAEPKLRELAQDGNIFAKQLLKLYSSNGQSYLHICEWILKKPSNQDTVVALFETLTAFLHPARVLHSPYKKVAEIESEITSIIAASDRSSSATDLHQLLHECAHLRDDLVSMLILTHADESVLMPVFAHTDAVGSVMRKKIEPIVNPVVKHLKILQGIAC